MKYNEIPDEFSTRLRIAVICSLFRGSLDFVSLKDATGATDGNLSAQLSRLEESGYIICEKTFCERKPRTTYSLTEKAQAGYRLYVTGLVRAIVGE